VSDVIIVLGAALDRSGAPGLALRLRLETAAAAFHAGRAPLIIVSGAGESTPMKESLVALGVPPTAILVEPRATSTRENAIECGALMRTHRLTHALVVTQPFHMRRALRCFTRAGFTVELLAAPGTPRLASHVRELGARFIYFLRGW
jgi:uncharacterized SAM-binding protein YcdF (DUF218 family)